MGGKCEFILQNHETWPEKRINEIGGNGHFTKGCKDGLKTL